MQASGSLYGALIGSVLAFSIADFLGKLFALIWWWYFSCWILIWEFSIVGRRRELMLAALFYLVGTLITTFTPHFVILVIGRFIYGIGIGLVILRFILLSRISCYLCFAYKFLCIATWIYTMFLIIVFPFLTHKARSALLHIWQKSSLHFRKYCDAVLLAYQILGFPLQRK